MQYTFKQHRFDNMRSYTADSVIASFKSDDDDMPDVTSETPYREVSEQYKEAKKFSGEVLAGLTIAKSKGNNFHENRYTELQLRDKADMLGFVESQCDKLSDPAIVAEKLPSCVCKWYFDSTDKILYVQTSRMKSGLSEAQLASEIALNQSALNAIASAVSAEDTQIAP